MGRFEIPYVPAVSYITIAFPKEMVDEVRTIIAGKQCNFSTFVIAAVHMALKDLADTEG